jgi:hypothetical protein
MYFKFEQNWQASLYEMDRFELYVLSNRTLFLCLDETFYKV